MLAEGGLDPTFVIGGRLKSAGQQCASRRRPLPGRRGRRERRLVPAPAADDRDRHQHRQRSSGDARRRFRAAASRASSIFCTTCRSTASRCCAATMRRCAAFCEAVARPYRHLRLRAKAPTFARSTCARRPAVALPRRCAPGHAPLTLTINLPGRHNVLNSLAAVAVATELDIADAAIQRALAQFPRHRPAPAAAGRDPLGGRPRAARRRLWPSSDAKWPRRSMRCARAGRSGAWCWRFSRIATRARAICSTISGDVLERVRRAAGDRSVCRRRGADRRRRRPRDLPRGAHARPDRAGVRRARRRSRRLAARRAARRRRGAHHGRRQHRRGGAGPQEPVCGARRVGAAA